MFNKKNNEPTLREITLLADVKRLQEELAELKRDSTPETVIKNILHRGIGWYDYNRLSEPDRISYEDNARSLLANPVFQNEINSFVSDIVQEIAYNADVDKILHKLRYSINGVEALRERIAAIVKPKEVVDLDDPHEAI